jgi:siroheme decarboxylase
MKTGSHESAPFVPSKLQRDFINHYQGNFPLQARPFKHIAEQLDSTEDELIETVKTLKDENILTRFGPLFDAAKLGGGLTLAAIAVPPERYDRVADMVNSFTEVAHNYRREHELNMWFVLATETAEEIQQVLQSIEHATGLKVFNFPKISEFYIGLWLNLSADGRHSTVPVPVDNKQIMVHYTLDEIDRKLISISQTGLVIETEPYQAIADEMGLTQGNVIKRLNDMLSAGIIRRIGAVPNHYRLGLTANGMTVWDVDDRQLQRLGNMIGQLDFVSHCYQRPRHLPMWPYNLFAMVHGRNKAEVNEKTKQIAELLADSCNAHDTLFSSAILKKTGLRLAA